MSKKLTIFIASILFVSFVTASTVPYKRIELVAKNFISQTTGNSEIDLALAHTAYNSNGTPLYYVFNLKYSDGFVIVAAEDAAYPIIGYSTQHNFSIPTPTSSIGNWLNARGKEINTIIQKNLQANAKIAQSWTNYIDNIPTAKQRSSTTTSVAPLLSTIWNQSPLYNDSCPGGSVTGCVATTMAQIMKYWNYPAHGMGSSSYTENDYGFLSSNYGHATYNYAAMPNAVNSPNPEVAKLMYHCGVSVQMDYSPAGSGAMVITADAPICAENSYITYFGYNPNTILGVHRDDYTDPNWHNLLKSDLNIGRPIQYVGFGNEGGHTWVCDGYDENNFYHMNWGWGGSANGYFNIDALNPGSMDFNWGQEALTGIVPIATNALDAGVLTISPTDHQCLTTGITPVIKFRNYGINNLTSCNINYKIDNQSTQTINWNGVLVTGQTATLALTNVNLSNGSHTVICNTSSPNGSADGNVTNDQVITPISLVTPDNLPLVDGFEDQSTYNHWAPVPSAGSNWVVNSQSASGGLKSIMIDNLNNVPGNVSILEGLNDYDLSNCAAVDLSFKVAYKQVNANSNDKLRLEVSNNCGKNWNLRWSKQGAELATTTQMGTAPFVPQASDYVSYSVSIPYYSSAILRWVFTSDATNPGNNLFLDNINLTDPTVGVKELSLGIGLNVYPNPAKDKVTIDYSTKETHVVSIDVIDLLGKTIATFNQGKVDAGNHTFVIETSQLKNGVYFLNIGVDGGTVVKKIAVQN